METIIKKAIEGGFLGEEGKQEKAEYIWRISGSVIVLDPLFWQSLGKVCGWGCIAVCSNCFTGNTESSMRLTQTCMKCGCKISGLLIKEEGWAFYALQFHTRNLTEGWDKAVEYLTNLIENK